MKKAPIEEYLSINLEALGLAMTLSPFADKISPNRNGMFATALSQYQIPINGESPNIFTGYEQFLLDYDQNLSLIENNFQILEVIPKFSTDIQNSTINISPMPSYYIIGVDLVTNELTYYEIRTFHKLNERYGYSCKIDNPNILNEERVLKKGEKIYSSIACDHQNNEYKFGCNANVMFASLLGTVEDAFIISDRLVKKLTPEGYENIKIKLRKNDYPLNLYGSDDDFKCIPDIGEKVSNNGVICAFRKKDRISIISDLSPENLKRQNDLLDLVFYTENDAVVVDIDVCINPGVIQHLPNTPYQQILKYHYSKLVTYKKVIEVYKKYKNTHDVSRKFNSLLVSMMQYLYLHEPKFLQKLGIYSKRKSIKLSGDIEDNDILINLIVKYPKPINIGSKITGRDGAKGVIGSIWPYEWMPVDENGIRADLVIDLVSVIGRNNIGQMYESYINRIGDLILQDIDKPNISIEEQFNRILEYINVINPLQHNIIKETCDTIDKKQEYLEYVKKNGIKLQIIAGLKTINSVLILYLKNKFNSRITKVKYKYQDENGNIQTVTTKEACCIGKKFIMLVYNEPEISSVNIGNVNTFAVPTTTSSQTKNYAYPVKLNCVRFGEDEFRMMLNTLGPEVTLRLRCLSTSINGLETIIDEILTAPNPSDIPHFNISNKDLLDSDVMVNVIHTICNAIGLDLKNTLADSKDIQYYHKTISAGSSLLYYDENELIMNENEEEEEGCSE